MELKYTLSKLFPDGKTFRVNYLDGNIVKLKMLGLSMVLLMRQKMKLLSSQLKDSLKDSLTMLVTVLG